MLMKSLGVYVLMRPVHFFGVDGAYPGEVGQEGAFLACTFVAKGLFVEPFHFLLYKQPS